MAESLQSTAVPLRHPVLVRVTHWIHTLAFVALAVSGVAILLAHPRLYWGETGGFGSPALFELPLPLDLDQSGWGRSLHFLSAWAAVLNGVIYAISGLKNRHFRTQSQIYNPLQRSAYLTVVFLLFPLVIVSGLAMSPAIGAALPLLVGAFGGHQSARTVHFSASSLLLLFLLVHIAMVYRAGFRGRMREMITGRAEAA
jgi:thiosulfate reductase cytochrome b subunit